MPRGPAKDTLPPDAASKVRDALAKCRSAKGLTNRDIAEYLGWDDRSVTNAMQADQPLRIPKAESLLRAVVRLHPKRNGKRLRGDEAWRAEVGADPAIALAAHWISQVRDQRWPAALIAVSDEPAFAKWFADRIGSRGGFSRQKRDAIEGAILSILKADSGKFAFAAHQRLIDSLARDLRPSFSPRISKHVLWRFGYR